MDIKTVVVIGAGTMGSGIAQWFVQNKCSVELVDSSSDQLKRALRSIHDSWDKLLEKQKLNPIEVSEMKSSLEIKDFSLMRKNPDLVVEAIVEDLEAKRDLFKKLDETFVPETIFASNTSSFPIKEMVSVVSKARRERFLGLHFFNPAPVMKLVEIIKEDETLENLPQELYQWFQERGKMPALCKDSPGFIVNRVARNFYGEALRIVETDETLRMREVDQVLREVGGFKMGPFELMDLIGIDINYSVTLSVWKAYHESPRFAPHSLQKKMVEENRLGKKVKKGFYTYD